MNEESARTVPMGTNGSTGTGTGTSDSTGTPRTEEFHVSGEELLAKVKELLHEGNIRRIVIRNQEGQVLAEFPLTAGVIGVLLIPVWAAIGAIAALAADLTIVVERRD
jgi:uncharacterized protein DUF4342